MADLIPSPIQPAPPQTNNDFRGRPGEIVPQSPDSKITTLSDLTQIVKNHNLSEEMGEQNLADSSVLIPRNDAFVPRDPAIAAKLLQALLGADMMSSLRANGSEELVNKLAEFADEVMQTPETLAADLAREQSKSTMFSGDLWKLLSGIFSDKIAPDADGVNLAKLLGNLTGNTANTAGNAQRTSAADNPSLTGAADTDKSGNAVSETAVNTDGKDTAAMSKPGGNMPAGANNNNEKSSGIYASATKTARNGIFENRIRQNDMSKPYVMTNEQMKQAVLNRSEASAFPKNEIYKNAAFDFLKSAVTTSSKEDILNSVAANLKYLASEAAPSMSVRNELNDTADNLNLTTFPELKGKILELLNTTSTSLLLNNNTKALIPLAVYNMSRLSYGTEDLTQSFSELLKLSDPQTADALKHGFIKYIENSDLSSEDKVSILEGSEIAAAKRSMTLIAERLADSTAQVVNQTPAEDLAEAFTKILDLFRHNTNSKSDNYNTESNVSAHNNTGGAEAKNVPSEFLQRSIDTVRDIVSSFTPDNMKGALNTVIRDFERTRNLNEFAGRLSMIVNKIIQPDKKMILAQALNDILGGMSTDESVNYTPPTSTETLADFLAKNINDPALRTLSELKPGEMVRSLLSAPGSNTPLMHMMAPLEIGGLRAFGELWLDPDAKWVDPDGKNGKKNGGADNAQISHVFLTFQVENTGYFEMELYARDKELNVSIACPQGMEERFAPLSDIIPRLVKTQGYETAGVSLSSIYKPRELRDVFPKLTREVTGLNVRC
jgi:hypothetical protein